MLLRFRKPFLFLGLLGVVRSDPDLDVFPGAGDFQEGSVALDVYPQLVLLVGRNLRHGSPGGGEKGSGKVPASCKRNADDGGGKGWEGKQGHCETFKEESENELRTVWRDDRQVYPVFVWTDGLSKLETLHKINNFLAAINVANWLT